MNTWDAQFTVDIKTAREVCSRECELKLSDIKQLGEGWDNVVYLVNKTTVFRFPRREIAVRCLLAELDLVPLVKTSLPVPRFRYSSRKSAVTGRPFVGYDLIAGRPAGELSINTAGKKALVRPIAKFLKELHSTRVPAVLRRKWRKGQGWRTDVPGRIALAEKRFRNSADLGVDLNFDFNAIKGCLSKARFPEAEVLVHGDLYPLHMIVDESRRAAGIIDWGDVHYGNPCLDLSIAFGYFPEELLPDFESVYGKISDEWKLASAFRTLCHGLSLLAFAADKKRAILKKQTLNSILTAKTWIEELTS
jgi:aminoglycoside phosphotransferase (APT) family kinase protein